MTAALHKLIQHAAVSAVISHASGVRARQTLEIKIKIEIDGARSARMAARAAAVNKMAGGRGFR